MRSGPGTQFTVGYIIPEGRRVQLLNTYSNEIWVEVGMNKEAIKGWVLKKQIITFQ